MRGGAGRPCPLHEFRIRAVRFGRIHISSGFFLLCSWLLYRDSTGAVWQGLLACALHEFGHWYMLRIFSTDIKCIYITAHGAKMEFENRLSYIEECFAAAAGPCVNLALAFACSRLLHIPVFAGVNLALALFNLLPIGPLDGARIVYCLIAQFTDESMSYRICRCVTFSFTLFFGVLGIIIALHGGNLTLFFVCLWLLIGAPSEFPAKFDQKEWK